MLLTFAMRFDSAKKPEIAMSQMPRRRPYVQRCKSSSEAVWAATETFTAKPASLQAA